MTNILLLNIIITLTTNWSTSYSTSTLMMPPEANTTITYESGLVFSNRVATVSVEGVTSQITLSSDLIARASRSYMWSKPQKVYSATTVEPFRTAMTNHLSNWFSTNSQAYITNIYWYLDEKQ